MKRYPLGNFIQQEIGATSSVIRFDCHIEKDVEMKMAALRSRAAHNVEMTSY